MTAAPFAPFAVIRGTATPVLRLVTGAEANRQATPPAPLADVGLPQPAAEATFRPPLPAPGFPAIEFAPPAPAPAAAAEGYGLLARATGQPAPEPRAAEPPRSPPPPLPAGSPAGDFPLLRAALGRQGKT